MPDPLFQSAIGVPFIELQTVDSTNSDAFRRIHSLRRRTAPEEPDRAGGTDTDPAQHGMAIFAHEQTAGKGQRGKHWASSAGQNIALTIIIRPDWLPLSQQFRLNACVSVAVSRTLRQYAGDDIKIKWPNDIYWKDRKVGGILIESIIGNQAQVAKWEWAVVGIGLNINQTSFPPDLPNPVSIKLITGKTTDPLQLAGEICASVNGCYQALAHGDFQDIYHEYLSLLYKRNEKIKLRKGNRVFEAVVQGVSPLGRLIVQHSTEEEFDFGAVEWIVSD